MAELEEIQKALKILLGAGLDFAPKGEEIGVRVMAWSETLGDIPGDLLIQGAKDLAITSERFPSLAVLRKAAWRANPHQNGREAEEDPYPFIAVVTREGWERWTPGRIKVVKYPEEIQAEIERLEAKYQGVELPTDEELAHLDLLLELFGGGLAE